MCAEHSIFHLGSLDWRYLPKRQNDVSYMRNLLPFVQRSVFLKGTSQPA